MPGVLAVGAEIGVAYHFDDADSLRVMSRRVLTRYTYVPGDELTPAECVTKRQRSGCSTACRVLAAGGHVRTGEMNLVGMPVIETPGTSTGTVTAAAVTASSASWALGKVPLNMAVRPT